MTSISQNDSPLRRFRVVAGPAICIFLTVLLTLGAKNNPGQRPLISPNAQSNLLAVSSQAKVKLLNLAINPASELDFKSKNEILELRRSAVFQHPELLAYKYEPDSQVFGRIVDGKPWWGLEGQLFYDSGPRSIEGLSEESRFLNNPFLLAAADMVLDGYTYDKGNYSSNADLARTALPRFCQPDSIYFYPPQAREDVTYNVSRFLKESARIVELPKQLSSAKFDIVAYNARDFGYNYLAIMPQYSRNISITHDHPVAINQFIHCGNSCGYPGGCNNMSPYNKDLFDLTLGAVPAQAVIFLWKKPPSQSQMNRYDFMVVLNFI